mgnify:CR=1 FL=1
MAKTKPTANKPEKSPKATPEWVTIACGMAGALFVPASGTFRAETGESKTASWLRFVRA